MSEYITLLGSEQVQSAGNRMVSAADLMQRAASQIDDALTRHERFMDDWLVRLENAIRNAPAIPWGT